MNALVFDLGYVTMLEAEEFDLTSITYWWGRVRERTEQLKKKAPLRPKVRR